jgi:hypothetical protein
MHGVVRGISPKTCPKKAGSKRDASESPRGCSKSMLPSRRRGSRMGVEGSVLGDCWQSKRGSWRWYWVVSCEGQTWRHDAKMLVAVFLCASSGCLADQAVRLSPRSVLCSQGSSYRLGKIRPLNGNQTHRRDFNFRVARR